MAEYAYEIVLTPEIAARLDALAARRRAFWDTRGVRTKKIADGRSDLEIDRMGAYGEYTCCQMLGIPFNWRHDRPDDDIDGVFQGQTVQIKATPYGNRLLLFRNLEHFKADIAILSLVSLLERRVQMVGWVSREDFLRLHEIRTVKEYFGPQPVLDRSRLHPPETLVPHFRPEGPPPTGDETLDLPEVRAARLHARAREREQKEREQRAQRAEEDRRKRAWIEAGNEPRQPPEYRGIVFDMADRDGVHPTAFPPLRDAPQEGLSDAFIAFQAHNQTRYETHPQYYCVECKIRYNAREGGRCGPCIGRDAPIQIRQGRRVQPPEYPT